MSNKFYCRFLVLQDENKVTADTLSVNISEKKTKMMQKRCVEDSYPECLLLNPN